MFKYFFFMLRFVEHIYAHQFNSYWPYISHYTFCSDSMLLLRRGPVFFFLKVYEMESYDGFL